MEEKNGEWKGSDVWITNSQFNDQNNVPSNPCGTRNLPIISYGNTTKMDSVAPSDVKINNLHLELSKNYEWRLVPEFKSLIIFFNKTYTSKKRME